jgi:tape measure domain-containing protein
MADLASLQVSLELQTAAFTRGMEQAQRGLKNLERAGKESNDSLSKMKAGFETVRNAAMAMGAAFASIKGFDAIVRAAEDFKVLQASMVALTGSVAKGSDAMRRIEATALRTGAPMKDVAEATQRLTIAMSEMGATNQQIQTVSETFLKLGKIGGSSVAATSGALVQLAQGLSAGKLQGDEFKSIMENVPLVMKTVAESLGVPIGKLKEMGAAGELTGEVVGNALIAAAGKVTDTFNTLPSTSEQAYNRLVTSAQTAATQINEAFGLSEIKIAGIETAQYALQNLVKFLLDTKAAVDSLVASFSSWSLADKIGTSAVAAGALAAIFAGPLVTAIRAVTLALATNPFGAFLVVATGAAVAVIANWSRVKLFFESGLPAAIDYLKGAWASGMASLLEKANSVANAILGVFSSMVNKVIEMFNSVVEGANNLSVAVGGSNIAEKLNEISVSTDLGLESSRAWRDEATKNFDAATKGYEAWGEATKKLAEVGAQADSATPKLNAVAGALEKSGGGGKAAANSLDQLKTKLEALLGSIDPVVAGQKRLAEGTEILNQALKAGLIDQEKYSASIEKLKQSIAGDNSIKSALGEIKDAVEGFTRQFVDGIVDAAFEGKLSFDKLLTDMAKSITKFMLNKMIQQFFKALSGPEGGGSGGILGGILGSANGNVFGPSGKMTAFAQGGIVSSPTFFGYKGGMGLMGEAGAEAILPLTRRGGTLGVEAAPVNITVINQAGVKVETSETQNPNGSREIQMLIRREVQSGLADGTYDKSMRAAFGMTRAGV